MSHSSPQQQPLSPLSLDMLSPLPPPPPMLDSPSFRSSTAMAEGGSLQASPSDRSSSFVGSSKRSLDTLMTASSILTTRITSQSADATPTLFDPFVLLNPPLSPAAAASLSPVEKVSLKQKLQKDLEWTQLMLHQRMLFLKQQHQQTP
jgi:hypothetical protein